MSALDTGQLNLVEATRFVEFDGDDEAQAELIKVAGTDQFDHRFAQLYTNVKTAAAATRPPPN